MIRAPRVRRVSEEPLVGPGSAPGYGAIFNAGVLYHDGRYHLFARGVRDGYRRNAYVVGPRFLDYISDVLVFTSRDGRRYRFQQVLAAGGRDGAWSFEDPRVQRIGPEDQVVMTYTHLAPPFAGLPWRLGLHVLTYDGASGQFRLDHESGALVGPPMVPNKDGVLADLDDGRLALIHRLYGRDMHLAVFDDLDELIDTSSRSWDRYLDALDDHVLIEPTAGSFGVGAGAPPLRTPAGLVKLFHERTRDQVYVMRAALLDPSSGRVSAMLDDPLLVPELDWERRGDVNDVVFVQGAVLRRDGTIYLTYGASDRFVGAAVLDGDELVEALLRSGNADDRLDATRV